MKLVFCGTPDFAVPTLQAVLDVGHQVPLVLTQPDRPAGRKMSLRVPPVKRLALDRGLCILQPERIKANFELRVQLERIVPDAIIVVAYGRIIPQWMLDIPRYGNINLHGSLLPKYRGAAPIQWALANGERRIGVSTMRLDAGLDTGDVLLERAISIGEDVTAAQVFPQLSHVGSELMLTTLEGLADGSLKGTPQDDALATLAPLLTREDGQLQLNQRTAREVYNRWRGFYPWPGAHGEFRGKRFLVHRMHPVAGASELSPGTLEISSGELRAGTAGGTAVVLDEVQFEGKSRMPGVVFARDFQLKPGEKLD